MPCPWYRPEDGLKFLEAHGLAVRAVGGPLSNLVSCKASIACATC